MSQSLTLTSLPPADEQRVPFSRLLAVEFRKSWDTRASFWLLVTIAALVVLAELITAIVTGTGDEDIAWGDFSAVAGFITGIMLPVLGIMLVTSEWSQRSAMVTFALEPRRTVVVYAKLVVGLLLTLATVVVAIVLGAVFNLLYAGIAGHSDWSFGFTDMLAFVLVQALTMLGGFALAALLLNTATAIVVYFAYKWALPVLFGIGGELMDWFASFSPWIDFQQAQSRLYDGWGLSGEEWGQLLVSGLLWLGVPLALGLRRILRAEVK